MVHINEPVNFHSNGESFPGTVIAVNGDRLDISFPWLNPDAELVVKRDVPPIEQADGGDYYIENVTL
jgi:hypothetical protein